ncbi:hypothetical protein K458DRAFT_115608 [Lentithecium fluviatile CBS 122367]|uniref:Uncharacterized protein n=1 Tax=Lentithecium fluviatile CBS 122367 TaxID=1168545 RepID=A0A6G1IN31_9PLEO|nr:hypothetical protein K458DRAFT_115608 [Lentithecium fluviatile CBS 122367]
MNRLVTKPSRKLVQINQVDWLIPDMDLDIRPQILRCWRGHDSVRVGLFVAEDTAARVRILDSTGDSVGGFLGAVCVVFDAVGVGVSLGKVDLGGGVVVVVLDAPVG